MNETLGQRFQRLRKNAGLTQVDVAKKLNITSQAVSKWENDVSAPDISVLVEISDILGVSLDELLGKPSGAVVLSGEEKRDINKLTFHIKVLAVNGDRINVNIPLALAKISVDSGMDMPKINGKDVLSDINLKLLIALIEQGVVGKLVEVKSAEGDNVEIWVE